MVGYGGEDQDGTIPYRATLSTPARLLPIFSPLSQGRDAAREIRERRRKGTLILPACTVRTLCVVRLCGTRRRCGAPIKLDLLRVRGEYRVDRSRCCKSTGTTKYSPATIPVVRRVPLYFPGKCRSTVTPRILYIISGKAIRPRSAISRSAESDLK